MEYEESNLFKRFPERFRHDCFKVLEWKWFNSRSAVGLVLVIDLQQKRISAYIGSPKNELSEEDSVKEILDWGASLPNDMIFAAFRNYFCRDEIFELLDKDLRAFLKVHEILMND